MDIWRSIADICPPALKEMIEIGTLGVSLTSPPDRQCHHLVFLPPTRVQLEVDRRPWAVSLVSIFEKGALGVSLTHSINCQLLIYRKSEISTNFCIV